MNIITVFTFRIAEKAKLKHTVKYVRLINIRSKKNHRIACSILAIYLTDNQTVSIRLICDYFFWGGGWGAFIIPLTPSPRHQKP